MKHIVREYNENIYQSAVLDFYFENMRCCALDIETTGLNPSRNKFILGGLYDFRKKTLHQVFAESRAEEKEALTRFSSLLDDFDMVITYNGKHFDIPFIKKRMAAYAVDKQMPYNLDLYLVINGHSPIKKFVPNLKQKTVENYMGLWQNRSDEISGGESVELYNSYEKSRNAELEEKILLHNSDDVLQLTRLLKVVSKCDFHKAMYSLGFPAENFLIEGIKTEKNELVIEGAVTSISMDYMSFSFGNSPADIRIHGKKGSFKIKLPVLRNSGLCMIDLKALNIPGETFNAYPNYANDFLVLENKNERNFIETNHFIKEFIKHFNEGKKE